MKLCQPHWDALKAAIEERGLMEFVAQDAKAAHERLCGELNGSPEQETFDPLMAANFAIWSNGLQIGGLYLMTGDFCPICESEKHNGPAAEWWITNAANGQLERARELKLLPSNTNQ